MDTSAEVTLGESLMDTEDHPLRPSFFEMAAAERLEASLTQAVRYAITAASERHGWAGVLSDVQDELVALVLHLVHASALNGSDASFSETLYGLQRVPSTQRRRDAGAARRAADGRQAPAPLQISGIPLLRLQHRHSSLMVLVWLPYICTKLDRAYRELRELQLLRGDLDARATPLARELTTPSEATPSERDGQGGAASPPANMTTVALRAVRRVRRWVDGAVASAPAWPEVVLFLYPVVHVGWEGLRLAYQVAYLLELGTYFAPEHRLAGVRLRRATATDARLMQARTRAARAQATAQARMAGNIVGPIREFAVRAAHWASDCAQGALVISVLAFKAIEWWYVTGEEHVGAAPPAAPPPPPPAPSPAPPPPAGSEKAGGAKRHVSIPADPRTCPLCCQTRSNPAVCARSGYLFCYTCLMAWTREHRCCPITHTPAGEEHVRRLFLQ
ncbi:unnamed protein product [Pedinophyceae sp. YPF-701]|nr:unnamed protein product [Pedinophyceae sp. YPF-701]